MNRRKYIRVGLKRHCVLICTDEYGNSKSYMSRSIDMSLGGVLIHKLESMFSNDYVRINPADFRYFNIVLFLDIDVVLKLSANYVRQEKGRVSYRYGFEFVGVNNEDLGTVSKYITQEQLRQRKQQKVVV